MKSSAAAAWKKSGLLQPKSVGYSAAGAGPESSALILPLGLAAAGQTAPILPPPCGAVRKRGRKHRNPVHVLLSGGDRSVFLERCGGFCGPKEEMLDQGWETNGDV